MTSPSDIGYALLYLAAAIVVAFGLWALCLFVIVGLG